MTDFAAVDGAPQSHDPDLLAALGGDLRAAGYTVDGVAALLGEQAHAALHRDQPVPALLLTRRLLAGADPHPLAAIVHLWLLGQELTAGQAAAAFPRTGTAGLLALGLVEADDDGGCRAAVDLRPYGAGGRTPDADIELWVASDLGAQQRPGILRRDHVLGIGAASLTLAQLTVRPAVERALDLGTGCGIQTFHLLRHAAFVVATDISARALAFTRFNLLLNAPALGLDPRRPERRVSLRQGDLLEPVAGEGFDLVVSNPPFVITPRSANETAAEQFTYRDGGLPGDQIVASLVRGLPGVLAPGGVAQMLGNWEIPGGADWADRLRAWLPAGTDAWVIQRERVGPAEYAETWLRDASENRDRDQYGRSYARYLADFAARGTAAIGFGMILLRNPPPEQPAGAAAPGPAAAPAHQGLPLRRFEEITHAVGQPLGPSLRAALGRWDWLQAHRRDFEAQHLQVAGDVTEERHQRPGAEHPAVILLRQGAGLRRTRLMSTELAGFVSASDGELAVGQIAGALAALLERDDPQFRGQLLEEVRALVLDGFLLPADAGPGGTKSEKVW